MSSALEEAAGKCKTTKRMNWRMYISRKRCKPQGTIWPQAYYNKRYYCFAHMRRAGMCKYCSCDVCAEHKQQQDECVRCRRNSRGLNLPCKKHLAKIQDCSLCNNKNSLVSFEYWDLCSQHLRLKKASKHSKEKHYKQIQEKIINCLLCSNRLESKSFRQERYQSLVKLDESADSWPKQRVQNNNAKVDGKKNLNNDKANSKKSCNNSD